MKLQLGHNTGEVKSAEEYRRLADEHAQTLKDFWKRFAVSGLFVLALMIILFASLAWFAANNSVDGTTSAISAKAARYSISGASRDGAKVGMYDGKAEGLESNDSLNVSATYNLNNYTPGSLRPGSYGELQVTVTPVAGDVRNITLTIERNIKLRDGVESSVTETLANLFRGHVLFFRAKSEDGYYSDPVLNDTLTIEASEFRKADSTLTTEPVTITLYWIWPSQFSSYVLTGQINYSKNLFASAEATGYSDLLAAINKNGGWFFSTDGTSTMPPVSSTMSSADLETCAEAYNAGDEVLGTNAEYLQIRFAGKEAGQ